MTITINDVKWGSYLNFEGPVFGGSKPYTLPSNPTFLEKTMAVISSTEGRINSINMYDVCIMTVGVIQWCDRGQFSVTNMLGVVAEKLGVDYVLATLKPALDLANATFRKNVAGKWRFALLHDGVETEVNSDALQKQLYLSCTGLKGSWTPEARIYAKTWCACMANIWDDQDACQAQVDFTMPKLMSGFVGANAHKILFSDETVENEGWPGAVRAAFLSFAINAPAWADKHIVIGSTGSDYQKWSQGWCLDVIKQLTFGPAVAIYPARYDAINSVLTTQFGVTMPKNSHELQASPWKQNPDAGTVIHKDIPVVIVAPTVLATQDVQLAPVPHTAVIETVPASPAVTPTAPSKLAPVVAMASKLDWPTILKFIPIMFGGFFAVLTKIISAIAKKK
jgi:hypothetical protein